MKLKSFVSALSVVILAAGCAKTGLDPVTSAPTYKLLLTGDLDTKTSLAPEADGKRSVLWKTGDMLGLFVQEGEAAMTGAQNVLARLEAADENTGAGFSKGSFATSLALTASTTYTLGIYYPYVSDAGAADAIDHHIPAVQTQPAASDSRHLGLSGHFSYATASFTTPAELADDYTPSASFTMSHKTSAILLSVKAGSSELAGWKVKSVKVTAPEGCYLSGDVQYVPSTDALTLTGNQSESVALNVPGGAALSVDAAAELYLVAFPTSLAGKNLTITYTLEAADASSVKTLTHTRAIKAESKALGAGRVHMFEEALPASDAEGWVYSAADAAFDLSANGTANCYIVSAPGKYSFDATIIGNGQKGILLPTSTTHFHTESATIAPASVELLWQTANGLITSVALENGRVVFTKSASVDYGNALIAVKNASGTILWSWHIWCTDMGNTQTYVSSYGTYEGMDRNLGATYASTVAVTDETLCTRALGLFYQWGRKDPFVGPETIKKTTNTYEIATATMYKIDGTTFKRTTKAGSATKSASVEYVVKNPTIFFFAGPATSRDWFCSGASLTGKGPESRGYYLWGNPEGYNYKSAAKPVPVKTIYDPCPVGYMVPPADFYSALAIKSRHSYCGKVCTTGGGTTTWFPSNSAIQAKNDAKDSDGNAAYNRWINDDMAYLWMSSFTSASSTQTWHCKLGSQVTSHNALYNAYGFGVRCIQELR